MSLRKMFKRDIDSDSPGSSSSDEEEENDKLPDESCDLSTAGFFESKSGVRILLHQEKVRGIAHQLWPAALILCQCLEDQKDVLFPDGIHNQVFCELGAGVGLCGIFVAALGAKKVVVTDVQEAIESLQSNIDKNDSLRRLVHAQVLMWGDDHDLIQSRLQFDQQPVILASDCVYWEHLYDPLFKTLVWYVNAGSTVIISHVKRWKKDTRFFAMCSKVMHVEVLVEDIKRVHGRRIIQRIYKMTNLEVRKPLA